MLLTGAHPGDGRRVLASLLVLSVLVPACTRAPGGLAGALASLPPEVTFVARLQLPLLGAPAVVAGFVARLVEATGGPAAAEVEAVLREARALTVAKLAPALDSARCGEAIDHVVGLMQATANGRPPRDQDVTAMRSACEHLGLAGCLLAARSQEQAVGCGRSSAAAGAPWAAIVEELPDAEAAAVTVAAALRLRVQPDVPRYVDVRWAAHALPGRLVVGQPEAVRAIVRSAQAETSRPLGGVLPRLAGDLPSGAALQMAYRGLGTPPSLQAAALSVTVDGGLAVTWSVEGGADLAKELAEHLAALRTELTGRQAAWTTWLVDRLGVTRPDATSVVAVLPLLVDAAVVTPRGGGVVVSARAPFDVLPVLSRIGEGTVRP